MTTVAPSTRRAVTATWGLLVAVGVLMVGNGLHGSLVGVRAELENFPVIVTGLVVTSYYVGFLLGSRFVPQLVANVGHIRVFTALASMASTAALVQAAIVTPTVWALMRVLTGFCLAGLYIAAESWLNGATSNFTRGRLLSVYMIVVTGGFAGGQLLLGVADPSGFRLFVLSSALLSLSVVPLALARIEAPSFELPARVTVREVHRIAPVGIITAVGVGLTNGTLVGMGPVYGTLVGMSGARVGIFMGLALIGAMLLQLPIGTWSDHFPRRRVILAVTLAAAAAAVAALAVEAGTAAQLGLMFVYGGLSIPLYSLAISHVNDLIPADQLVGASAVLVFAVGVGAVAGPLSASLLVEAFGTAAFWWMLAATHVGMGVFVAYRLVVQRPIPVELQRAYLAVPARASALVAQLADRLKGNGR